MKWSKFFKLLLRNTITGCLISAILLGSFGYFLVGETGFKNGAVWGVILGITGGLITSFGMTFPILGGEYSQRYGKEQFRQVSEGDDPWPRSTP